MVVDIEKVFNQCALPLTTQSTANGALACFGLGSAAAVDDEDDDSGDDAVPLCDSLPQGLVGLRNLG